MRVQKLYNCVISSNSSNVSRLKYLDNFTSIGIGIFHYPNFYITKGDADKIIINRDLRFITMKMKLIIPTLPIVHQN